jgi:hypothetical protein
MLQLGYKKMSKKVSVCVSVSGYMMKKLMCDAFLLEKLLLFFTVPTFEGFLNMLNLHGQRE